MINRKELALAATSCLMLLMAASGARAVVIASDSAANPAYAAEADGAWKGENPGDGENPPGTDNGGFGFMPWSFAGGYGVGGGPYGTTNHFIDGVDFPTTSYNNLGAPAFGLANEQLAQFFITATATRPFAQTLAAGSTFSAEIDTPANYDDYSGSEFPFAIVTFQDSTGADTVKLEAGSSFVYGDFPWDYSDKNHTKTDFGTAAGGSPIAPTATSNGSSVSLKVTSATSGRLTLNGTGLDVDFIAGLPAAVTFTLFDNNAVADEMGHPTGEHAFYFDNLKIESAGTPGDYNGNGKVDAADYTVWRNNLGSSSAMPNDPIGGTIGTAQYNQWKTNFGTGAGGGALATAVPEPTSVLALIAGATTVLLSARGRSNRTVRRSPRATTAHMR